MDTVYALIDATTHEEALAALRPLSVNDARLAVLDAFGAWEETAAALAEAGLFSDAVTALGFKPSA